MLNEDPHPLPPRAMPARSLRFALAVVTLAALEPARAQSPAGTARHVGMCDASAAVALGVDYFVVANDEDNLLRVYEAAGSPDVVRYFDLTPFLMHPHREADLEGTARIGDTVYWITSHGLSRSGERQPPRYQFLAVRFETEGREVRLRQVGQTYTRLLADLLRDPRLAPFALGRAAARLPQNPDGLNIEGLSATPGGDLLIAFRNPVAAGRALVVPLENPEAVVQGAAARFGPPITLDLGGTGIRSMEYWPEADAYLIATRPETGTPLLFRWSGRADDRPEPIPQAALGDFNPEALFVYPGGATLHVLSDDGAVVADGGRPCKQRRSAADRQFRSLRLRLPDPSDGS